MLEAMLLPETILVYGTNFILFLVMKFGKTRQLGEKIAIFFGINMSLILVSLIVIVVLRMVEVGFISID